MTPTSPPSIQDIERIALVSDPVLRNLQITQCYHELALVLAERTRQKANWCTFATWASKQAGQTIRKEDLSRLLEGVMEPDNERHIAVRDLQEASHNLVYQQIGIIFSLEEFAKLVWKAYDPASAFERSSAAVARGNLKVFTEIAHEFARFYAECLPDLVFDAANLTRFCDHLRLGDPPAGQRMLKQAFQHYYQALFEADDKTQAELLLLANLEIGFHEQTRLQPEINDALDAPIIPPQEFARSLLKVLHPEGGWISELTWFILRLLGQLTDFDRAVEKYVSGAQRQVQFLVTETMMTIELPPPNKLRLGNDLTVSIPPLLECIDNPDLLALLVQIDPTPDNLAGSGAVYWGDLSDRIHFIADMFRCYELSSRLLDPPFSIEQAAELKNGRVPTGRL
jgi:hypothetical protein